MNTRIDVQNQHARVLPACFCIRRRVGFGRPAALMTMGRSRAIIVEKKRARLAEIACADDLEDFVCFKLDP